MPFNKHPLRIGIPGRWYSRYDCVTPIVDAMMRLHEKRSFAYLRAGSKRKSALPSAGPATGASPPPERACVSPRALCEGCGTTDHARIEFDFTNGVTVCQCGVTSRHRMTLDEWSATNTSEDGTKTARADAVPSSSEPVPMNRRMNNEFAAQRDKAGRAAQRGGFSGANKIVAGEAARRAEETEIPIRDQGKLAKLIMQVDDLLLNVAPVEKQIARHIRMVAESVFTAAVKHRMVCGKSFCQMAICDRPVRVLASKLILHALDVLLAEGGIQGVSNVSLTQLHGRMQSDHVFIVRDNATQHESTMAVISELRNAGSAEPCSELPSDESFDSLSELAARDCVEQPPLKRQASGLEPAPSASKVVVVRDAVSRLASEFNMDDSVREAAIRSLNNFEFANAIKTGTLLSADATKFATAYLLLRAVAKRLGKDTDDEEHDHAARLGMSREELKAGLRKVAAVLPALEDADDDEDLY